PAVIGKQQPPLRVPLQPPGSIKPRPADAVRQRPPPIPVGKLREHVVRLVEQNQLHCHSVVRAAMWEDGFRTRHRPHPTAKDGGSAGNAGAVSCLGGSIATIMSLMGLNPSSHTAALTLVRHPGSADLIIADSTRHFRNRFSSGWRGGSRYAARTVVRVEEKMDGSRTMSDMDVAIEPPRQETAPACPALPPSLAVGWGLWRVLYPSIFSSTLTTAH